MFGYFIGLFWGFIIGGFVGLSYNFIKNITESYIKEKNPKKILMKKIYEQISDRKSTRLNSSHSQQSRMPSSA